MKLTSLNKLISFLIISMLLSTANAEEEINIWDKKDDKEIIDKPNNSIDTTLNQLPKLEKVETTNQSNRN